MMLSCFTISILKNWHLIDLIADLRFHSPAVIGAVQFGGIDKVEKNCITNFEMNEPFPKNVLIFGIIF